MAHVYIVREMGDYRNPASRIIELMEDHHVFILKGNLGAGKTTLVQAICEMIGTEDVVTSPTFALINPYITQKGKVFHMDMYRIKSAEEAMDFGIEEYLWDEDSFCFIEWPDQVEILLPGKYVEIVIELAHDQSREISIRSFHYL